MVEETRLEAVDSRLTPATEGWFVVNVRDAAWLTNDPFGARCIFEADTPVVRTRPDLDVRPFADLGVTLAMLAPGRRSGPYHAQSNQDGFLVLSGDCLLLVESEERPLRAWDPGTKERPHNGSR